MDEDQLMEFLSSPEMADELAKMGVYQDRQAIAAQQAKRADALRATPNAQGMEVGHTFVAASPLEHMAVAMQRMRGENQLNNAVGQQNSLIQGDVDARKGFASALAQAMQRARQNQALQATQPPSIQGMQMPRMVVDGPPTAYGELPTLGS